MQLPKIGGHLFGITDVSPQVQIAPTVTPRVYFAQILFRPKTIWGVWADGWGVLSFRPKTVL